MREYTDSQGIEPIEPNFNQLKSEANINETLASNTPKINPIPTFPASQRECAQYFGISPAAFSKWIKALENAGVVIATKNRKITSEGFELLCEYSQAGDRAYFLECLQPPQPQESKALAIRSDSDLANYNINFDEVFAGIEADYNALDGSESATSQELAIYEAELVEFSESYNTKEAQAHAIRLRKEAEKAALLAKEVHKVRQAAFHQTLERLEAKSTNFR